MHKKFLISGGNGNIAKALVNKLTDSFFILLARNKNTLQDEYNGYKNVKLYVYEDLFNNTINLDNIDYFIHAGFERSENTENLVKSLELSSKIFQIIQNSNIESIINLSTMSAYSFKTELVGLEKNPANPTNFYGLAKVASEILLESICNKNKYIVNVRLAALSGPLYEKHILTKFIKNAIINKRIEIKGGSQNFCFMDTRDAIDALCILINSNPEKWEKVYNISDNTKYNIVDLAHTVLKIVKDKLNINAKLRLTKTNDFYFDFSLNADKFMKTFNWSPKYTLEDTINEIIKLESSLICSKK